MFRFTAINTDSGREIGAHLSGSLVAIRISGAWVPPYEDRCMGLSSVCPLVMGAIRKSINFVGKP